MKKPRSVITKISKYLPVFIILFSLTIIIGSTFAYFTDKNDKSTELIFSKVELSDETNVGINGVIRDVIPGAELVDGSIKFSKSIDSTPIYVRAKLSFSLPEQSVESDMQYYVDELRNSNNFNINSNLPNNAVWSAKQGDYFYLLDKDNSTSLKKVDTIDTYTLSDSIIIPRDLKNLSNNVQYMQSINFYIGFEAIQADNVDSNLIEAKKIFNEVFPPDNIEENSFKVTIYDEQGSIYNNIDVNEGSILSNIEFVSTDKSMVFLGWYEDEELTSKFDYNTVITDNISLYPKVVKATDPNKFTFDGNIIKAFNGSDSDVVIPSSYSIDGTISETVNMTFYIEYELIDYLRELPDDKYITIQGRRLSKYDTYAASSLRYPVTYSDTITKPNYIYGDDYKVKTIDYQSFYSIDTLENVIIPNGITTIADYAFAWSGNLTTITISDTVTSIGSSAFTVCDSLLEVYIPGSVKTIGSDAFTNCSNLSKVTIEDGVETIGSSAFTYALITSIEIPKSVKTIGDNPFSRCSNLSEIIANDNEYYYVENDCLIEKTTMKVVSGIATSTIPDGILIIGQNAFAGCTGLTNVVLPQGLVGLEWGAFVSCKNLASINIPNSVESIGNIAFEGCALVKSNSSVYYMSTGVSGEHIVLEAIDYSTITSISWPSNTRIIADSAFHQCRKVSSITIPNTVKHIGYNAFYDCELITSISIPNSVITIADSAFSSCTALKTVTIGSGVEKIGNSVFNNCDALTSITIPGNVKSIGSAFYGCDNLQNVTISNGVEQLGENMFNGCKKISAVEIPASVTKINGNPFGNCNPDVVVTVNSGNTKYHMENNCLIENDTKTLIAGLKSTTIPKDIEIIGEHAFYFSTYLTSLVIPDSVKVIEGWAISYCRSLTSITLGSGLKTIKTHAFFSTGIVEVVIPDNVEEMEDSVFGSNSSLTKVTMSKNVKYIADSTFEYCRKLENINLDNITSIGNNAFYGCTGLKSLSLSANIDSIGNNAFQDVTAYILCENDKVAVQADLAKATNVYLLDTLTDFRDFDFVEVSNGGDVNATYSNGENTWARIGEEGNYKYYIKNN